MKSLNKRATIAELASIELRRRIEEMKYSAKTRIYRTDPLLYFEERLKINPAHIDWVRYNEYKNHTWDGTPNPFKSILEGLLNNEWVGVESSTGTGKTFTAALIALWFLECFENSVVVTTAPKQEQLTLHIWKEIAKLHPLFARGEMSTLRLRMIPGTERWSLIGFAAGIKTDEESATRAQGFHSRHMLFILEETPGIPAPIITAFQNTCTAPHNLILALGNPDNQYDSLHQFCMMKNVRHIRISGYDHPNVVLDNPELIPGAVSKEGLKRMLDRYGEDSPLYLSRARGISPRQALDSLIKIEWCISSQNKTTTDIEGLPALGVDAANSLNGDKAAIAFGIGAKLVSIDEFNAPDCNALGKNTVMQFVTLHNILPGNIGIDGVGVGAGTVNALKELGINAVNLIGSASPFINQGFEKFANLRSQMYWQLREDLRAGMVSLPNSIRLVTELTSIKWTLHNDKITIESKDEIKKRIGHSPNLADAAVYWNWVRVPRNHLNEISVY